MKYLGWAIKPQIQEYLEYVFFHVAAAAAAVAVKVIYQTAVTPGHFSERPGPNCGRRYRITRKR